MAGARGFSQVDRRDDGSLVAHGVAWVRATDFFLVFMSGPGTTVTPDDAAAVATVTAGHATSQGRGAMSRTGALGSTPS